jgi:DNA repair exonuclease SbcCD nuclease subunit
MDKKILVFGDLHIGVNKNNPEFFKITLDYADWLISILEKNKISTIVQLGDIFHFRENVHSTAINCAFEFFSRLKKYKIHIITGNHDSLYNDTSDVNSLKLLNNWPNIKIYEKVTSVDGMCFCGWGCKINDIPKNQKIVFGHFDIKGFDMSASKISEHGFTASELMEKCSLLMSGHYHKPQTRFYNQRPLIYTGSAFQLNWGESGEEKYAYIVDTETLDVTPVTNDVSPKFIYIRSENDYPKAKNNFVSVEIDKPEEFQNVVIKMKSLEAKDVRTTSKPIKKTSDVVAVAEFKGVSILDAIDEYYDIVEITDEEREYVKKHSKELYDSIK